MLIPFFNIDSLFITLRNHQLFDIELVVANGTHIKKNLCEKVKL